MSYLKKIEIPSHIKKFTDKATANLLPVKSAGQNEAEYQKSINVNRSYFAELGALPTEISINFPNLTEN
jgi:hypothetical protein